MRDYIFTSESVAAGHPDKVCDFISDSILDAFLRAEPEARVAVECLASTNRVILAGEVRPHGLLDAPALEALVRAAVREIGYTQDGFHWQKLKIESCLNEQSPDIAQGVDGQGRAEAEGAGDQGAMFGYACRETAALMPAPLHYAHEILRRLDERRRAGALTGLGPDAKTQLSLRYRDGMPHGTEKLVLSVQHEDGVRADELRALVTPIVAEVLPAEWMPPAERFLVNPTGRFVIGGPQGDAGLTGRKIIVDTYGGAAPHGGGAFSGKDPTKVDRSAAYAARYLAKNVVAARLAERCTLQLAYAIGVAQPLALHVDLHGTGKVDEAQLLRALPRAMDLTPYGIRSHLQLNKPIYARTAAYGHFGRAPEPDGGFSWEKTDLQDAITAAL